MEPILITQLKKYQPEFHPVVPFDTENDKLVSLDLGPGNTELRPEIFSNTTAFTNWITNYLKEKQARYAIGGYDENRAVYSFSKVFDAEQPGEEPRRLHLGTDIWGKPHTAVMSPLSGIVHSYAYNDQPGDYGATIILSHILEGTSFHTLYGHLSLNSIKNIYEGQRIVAGDIIGDFGIPSENGQWPAHLHFQIIEDLGNRNGDYPGVCKLSEKESWLVNSPDPDLILQMNQYCGA
jgi:murein DD-endopeptidase MepM/ murein hydrolase activator NlpD